jgi:hypothetical protein
MMVRLGFSRGRRRTGLVAIDGESPEATRYIEGLDDFGISTDAPTATGWNDSCRRDSHPLKMHAVARRTVI